MTTVLEGMLEESVEPRPDDGPRPRAALRTRVERAVLVAVTVLSVAVSVGNPWLAPGPFLVALTLVGLVLGAGPNLAISMRWQDPMVTVVTGLALGLSITLLTSTVLVEAQSPLGLVVPFNAVLAVCTAPRAWRRAGTWTADGAGPDRKGPRRRTRKGTEKTSPPPPGALTEELRPVVADSSEPYRVALPESPGEPTTLLPPVRDGGAANEDRADGADSGSIAAPAPARPRRTDRWVRVAQFTGLLAALLAWWYDTRTVDLELVGGRGLISVVGPGYLIALVLLALVAASALVRPRLDHLVLIATAAATATVGYLYISVATGVAGFGTVWVHVGFIDYIVEHGRLAQGLDARFSWPGFFAAGAALVRAAELDDAAGVAMLAPLWLNLAIVPGLLVVGRFVTRSLRGAWLAVFVYLVFNWFSQDYFAPQSVGVLLYVSLLVVFLHQLQVSPLPQPTGSWFARLRQVVRRVPGRPPGVSASGMVGRELLLLTVSAAIVVTHQLTPVAVMGLAVLFAITGNTRHRTLALWTGLVFLGWFTYGAADFWKGHLTGILQDVGQFGQNFNRGLSERLGLSDPTYDAMQRLRILWSAVYMLLGLLGGVVVLRRRYHPVLIAGVVAVPFALIGVQSYGGEVIFRSFVLAAPMLASLSALALLVIAAKVPQVLRRLAKRPAATGWSRSGRVSAAVLITIAGCLSGLMLTTTRGLNVGFERITATEMSGAEQILASAPDGATVGLLDLLGPPARSRVGEVQIVPLAVDTCSDPSPSWTDLIEDSSDWPDPVKCVMEDPPDYIYLTEAQITMNALRGGLHREWAWTLVRQIQAAGDYQVLYEAPDTLVLVRPGVQARTQPTPDPQDILALGRNHG